MRLLSIQCLPFSVFLSLFWTRTDAFTTMPASREIQQTRLTMILNDSEVPRRDLFRSVGITLAGVTLSTTVSPRPSLAASRKKLEECLYTILRVREATQQEARLIKTGKFKDVQRANVKLAVKYIVNNYRLADTFVAASTYIEGDPSRRVAAGDQGQAVVQNLYTILEYFDSSDVQNLKVGSSDNMSGKEDIVLKGLETARQNIDDFLAYFPKDKVEAIRSKILEENELNRKEWDPSLGDIVNLPQVV